MDYTVQFDRENKKQQMDSGNNPEKKKLETLNDAVLLISTSIIKNKCCVARLQMLALYLPSLNLSAENKERHCRPDISSALSLFFRLIESLPHIRKC